MLEAWVASQNQNLITPYPNPGTLVDLSTKVRKWSRGIITIKVCKRPFVITFWVIVYNLMIHFGG